MGAFELMMVCAQRTLAAVRSLEDATGICRSLSRVGWILGEMGRIREAADTLDEMLSLARELGDTTLVINALQQRADALDKLNEKDEADRLHEEADTLMRQSGGPTDPRDIGVVLIQKSARAFSDGNLIAALRHAEEAEAVAREANNRLQLCHLSLISSSIYNAMNDRPRARACAEQLEAFARELWLPKYIAAALRLRSLLTDADTSQDTRLALADEEIQIRRALGQPRDLGDAIGNRAEALAELRRQPEAMEGFRAAERIHRELGYDWGLPRWLLGRASILAHPPGRAPNGEELTEALSVAREGLKIARSIKNDKIVPPCASLVAEILVALYRPAEAERLLLDLINETRTVACVAQLHTAVARHGLDRDFDHAGAARRMLEDQRNESNAEMIDKMLEELNEVTHSSLLLSRTSSPP